MTKTTLVIFFVVLMGLLAPAAYSQTVYLGPCVLVDNDNSVNQWVGMFNNNPASEMHAPFGGKFYDSQRSGAPGESMTFLVRGSQISTPATASGNTWPTTLGGFVANFDGMAAPIQSVLPVADRTLPGVDGAITVQIPYMVTGYTLNGVQYVHYAINSLGCQLDGDLPLLPAVPALYRPTWASMPTVKDAVTGVVNDGQHPFTGATAQIAVYAYGLGKLLLPTTAGIPFPTAMPLANTTKVTVVVDGMSSDDPQSGVKLEYAGDAPGTTAQYVIVAQVPATAASTFQPWRYGQIWVNGVLAGDFQYAVLPVLTAQPCLPGGADCPTTPGY